MVGNVRENPVPQTTAYRIMSNLGTRNKAIGGWKAIDSLFNLAQRPFAPTAGAWFLARAAATIECI